MHPPRVQILLKIDELQNEHCKDCEKIKAHRKKSGNANGRDTFCNTQCEIGEKLQHLGQLLLENKAKKPKQESKIKIFTKPKRELKEVKKKLTKELYLDLTAEGKTNKQIIEMFGLNNVKFYKMKNEWGLVNSKFNRAKKTEDKVQETVDEKEVAPEVETIQETPKEEVIKKPCDCTRQLQDQILTLKSDLAQQKKENEHLVHCIADLQKYKKLYFTTVETLKIHLP